MTSPDVSQYVDLTLYDADPSQLLAVAETAAQLKFPGWNPQEGNTEVVLLESLALIVSELIYVANRIPGATVETLLQLYGITRNPGTQATATVTFNFVDTGGYTVPAGTRLGLTLPFGVYTFTTNTAIASSSGSATATGPVTCTQAASAPDGTAAGTNLTVLDQVWAVNTAVLATVVANGTDPETDTQWLDRGAATLQGTSNTLATADQFTTAAINDIADNVYRAMTTDQWNPAASGGAGGTAAGYVTVSVLGEGNVLLTTPQKNDLQALLEADSVAGLSVVVVNPTVTTVPITCTVWQQAGYTPSQVQANVAASLVLAPSLGGLGLTTDLWSAGVTPWTNVVRLNDIITVITNTPGVAYVASMSTPTADVPLGGIAPLATLGALTVNVEGP